MKIKWGALVTDGRGKLGGHVASANKGGSYLRTKVTPVNPRTVAQTEVRSLFGQISQAWGDLKQPSGKALYQRLNQQARLVGFPAIALPPSKVSPAVGIITGVELKISTTTITYAGAPATAAHRSMYYATGPVSRGTTFVKNRLRVFATDGAIKLTPIQLYTAYVAKYGTPTVTQKVFFGIVYVETSGQASPMQSDVAVIS